MKQKGSKTVPPITDGITRIKAMKDGIEKYFSEMAWEIGKLQNRGWQKVGVMSDAVKVETEEIELSEIPTENVEIEGANEGVKTPEYPTDEEIKTFLKENGVKFHHALGTKKLRELYDANTK